MKKIKIWFFWWLWTLGKATILELQKQNVNSNIYVFCKPWQDLGINFYKPINFISYKSFADLYVLLRKIKLDVILDMVWSYSFWKIDKISQSKINKLVEDNYLFHANLISAYVNTKKKNKKLIIITSSSVNKVDSDQPLYSSLKTWLSHLIKSVNNGLSWDEQIIEYQPKAFKSDIYKKAQSNVPHDLYSSFKEPIYYAKKIVNLIKNIVFI